MNLRKMIDFYENYGFKLFFNSLLYKKRNVFNIRSVKLNKTNSIYFYTGLISQTKK